MKGTIMGRVRVQSMAVLIAIVAIVLALCTPQVAYGARPDAIPTIPGSTHIVVPGTDDADGSDEQERQQGWISEDERVVFVQYPAELAPFVGGLFGESYGSSVETGITNTIAAVRDTDGAIVLYGFSQGARVAGDTVEQLQQSGEIDSSKFQLILKADPRFPATGAEEQLLKNHPILSWVLQSVFDVDLQGERDTAATGDIPVTSVAIVGDPVTGLETWYLNPVGFALNTVTGFLTIHSGVGPQSYGTLDELAVRDTWVDGSTTYVVYDADHPAAQALQLVGVPTSEVTTRFFELIAPRTTPGHDPVNAFDPERIGRDLAALLQALDSTSDERGDDTTPPRTEGLPQDADDEIVSSAATSMSPIVTTDPVPSPVNEPKSEDDATSDVPETDVTSPEAPEVVEPTATLQEETEEPEVLPTTTEVPPTSSPEESPVSASEEPVASGA